MNIFYSFILFKMASSIEFKKDSQLELFLEKFGQFIITDIGKILINLFEETKKVDEVNVKKQYINLMNTYWHFYYKKDDIELNKKLDELLSHGYILHISVLLAVMCYMGADMISFIDFDIAQKQLNKLKNRERRENISIKKLTKLMKKFLDYIKTLKITGMKEVEYQNKDLFLGIEDLDEYLKQKNKITSSLQ